MVYGYIRVSTDKQDFDGQKHSILEYANDKLKSSVEFVVETISSRKSLESREIYGLIKKMREFDVLVVSELSRLARSTYEIMTIFKMLLEKNVKTIIIKGNLIIDAEAHKIQSQVLIFAFSLAAEIERDLISERTKSALKAKKAAGVVLGRPKGSKGQNKLNKHEIEVKKLLAKGVNYSSIAKIYDCSRTTVENFVKIQKLKEAENEKNNNKTF